MEGKLVLHIFVERVKKRNSLNVVPVKVRNEDVGRDWLAVGFALQLLPQGAEAGPAVKDVKAVAEADFDARSVPSVPQVLGLRSGCRSPHSPKLDPHTLPLHTLLAED